MSDGYYSFHTSDHTEWDGNWHSVTYLGMCDECECLYPIEQIRDYGAFKLCLNCLGVKRDE